MSYGYLRIRESKVENENDKKIQQAISGNKLYIIDISSTCYIVDDITGEILDYCFEKLDKHQTYEYFSDLDKYIIFITENKDNLLKNSEILDSVLALFEE